MTHATIVHNIHAEAFCTFSNFESGLETSFTVSTVSVIRTVSPTKMAVSRYL